MGINVSMIFTGRAEEGLLVLDHGRRGRDVAQRWQGGSSDAGQQGHGPGQDADQQGPHTAGDLRPRQDQPPHERHSHELAQPVHEEHLPEVGPRLWERAGVLLQDKPPGPQDVSVEVRVPV